MRVAYVINSVEGGGASQPVPAIAQVLRDGGAKVRVFALSARDRRGLPGMIAAGLDPLVRDGGTTDHLAAALWLRRQIRDWGATHLWTSLSRATILGLILGPRLGLPVICWQHNAFLKPCNRRLLRLLQARALLWVGDSRYVTALTAERLDVPEQRLVCWPIFAADPDTPQARPWQPGQTLRIGSLGRLHPNKGYDVLIDALAQLRRDGFSPPVPFEMVVAGDGAQRERLVALARRAELANVTFAGYTEDPRSFLSSLHLYLQPSRAEGFCIAAHEAMTAGLPVVASAVGELSYSIQPGVTGMAVPPGQAAPLAEALRALLARPQQLHRMGQAARSMILARFSRAQFVATGTAILQRIRQAQAGRCA